jgi:hypothetical protein
MTTDPTGKAGSDIASGVAPGDSSSDDRVGDGVRSGELRREVDGIAGGEPQDPAMTITAMRIDSVRNLVVISSASLLGIDDRGGPADRAIGSDGEDARR